MRTHRLHNFYRLIAAFVALMVFLAAAPMPVVHADGGVPSFSIVSVKADESVRIRTSNFPASTLFTVRMDVVGKAGVNGIIVTQTNTGAGGAFEETYAIPAELKGKAQIAIRLESSNGYYAYNWFNNNTTGQSPVATPTAPGSIPTTGKGINIKIAGVSANKTVTIDANNFPANLNFRIRVGPFYNFWKGGEVIGTINSGNGGNFRFTVNLPDAVRNVELVSIRLDSVTGGYYAYNAFKNVDLAVVTPVPGSVTPVPSVGSCTVTTNVPGSVNKSAEFDARWTIKNTGNTTWDMNSVDYKFLSGTEMHKRDNRFDLPNTVKPGQSITLIVDMVAPKYSGYYSTTWGIVSGNTTLCSLPAQIYVK